MLVKVCGMRQPANVEEVAAFAPDFMGFIFYKGSKRFAGQAADIAFIKELPAGIKKVGVFVNETAPAIQQLVSELHLDLVQLHGDETPELCAAVQAAGTEVIKAFSVDENFNFDCLLPYQNCCDYFLFDTKGTSYGGNGITFDWRILDTYTLPKPYFLSGGLNLQNISHVGNIRNKPYALDVNSGFEIEPGLKDVSKVQELMGLVAGC